MAEQVNQGLSGQKVGIGEEIKQVFDKRKRAIEALYKADEEKDYVRAKEIKQDVLTMTSMLDRLEKDFDVVVEQEETQKVAEVSKSSEALRTGGYKELAGGQPMGSIPISSGMFNPLTMATPVVQKSPQQIDREKKELLSTVSGLPASNISTKSELSKTQKLFLGALSDGNKRLDYLKKEFGSDAVFPVEIGNDVDFLIKKPDGTAFSTEFKGVPGLAGAAVTELPKLTAEVGAGIVTLSGTKSPSAAIIASGAARTGVGTGVDMAVEKLAGVDPEFMTAFSRNGVEGAVSVVTGFGVDRFTSRFLAPRIAPNVANEFADGLRRSAERLGAATGKEITVPVGVIAGPEGLARQSELASQVPDAPFAGQMKRTQAALRDIFNSYVNAAPVDSKVYAEVAKAAEANRSVIASNVAKSKNAPELIVADALNNKVNGIAARASDRTELGNTILRFGDLAEQQAVRIKNEAYDTFNDAAAKAGFEMDAEVLYSQAKKMATEASKGGAFSNSSINNALSNLKAKTEAPKRLLKMQEQAAKNPLSPQQAQKMAELQELAKPITTEEFDAWIRVFRDARPDDATGAATTKQFANDIANKMSAYRREVYGGYDTVDSAGQSVNLGDLYDKTVGDYASRMELTRGTMGSLLKSDAGEMVKTPFEAVSLIIRDPKRIEDFLSSVAKYESADPALAGASQQVREMLQKEYFRELGFNTPGKSVRTVSYKPEFINSLFGKDAPQLMRSLDELNRISKKVSNLSNNLTIDDIRQMSQVMDQTTQKKLLRTISDRALYEQELNKQINSEVYKLASRGDFEKLDPALLSRTILSDRLTVGETKTVMEKLAQYAAKSQGGSSAKARNFFKTDFLKNVLDDFPGGEPTATAPFTQLFDTEAFIKAMDAPTGKSSYRLKMEVVLGKDKVQELYDLASVYNANIIKTKSAGAGIEPRVVGGPGGKIVTYFSGSIVQPVRNRILAIMLSSGNESRALTRALNVNAASGDVDAIYRKMFKRMFTTSAGLESLGYHASQDEEFSKYMQTTAEEFRKDSELFEAEMEKLNSSAR